MAGQKRKLGIPIYETGEEPAGIFDEDVIDAEWHEDDVPLAERLRATAHLGAEAVSEAVRNVRVNGVRDFLRQPADRVRTARGTDDRWVRARQQGREQRAQQDDVRKAQRADAKATSRERARLEQEAKRDPLAKLRLDTMRAGEWYMAAIKQSGLLDSGQTKETQRKQLSGIHQVYASMMVLQCFQPLKDGLNGKSVVTTLGMAASMWMMSPDFRTHMGNGLSSVRQSIVDKIDERTEKKDEKARNRFEKLAKQGKGDQLGRKWRMRLERIERAERGHRLPFTAQSAAMTEVALAEAAYADMRRPGANVSEIDDRYRTALSALYEYIEEDGIAPEEVSRSMRVIVGTRLETEPELASVFSELAHGRYAKSEPREVYINGTGEKATVWTGDFIDAYGGNTIMSGSFRMRERMGADEHRVHASETLAAELVGVTSVEEMDQVFSQYVVAASVRKYPEVVDELTDPSARTRFGKVRAMFSSMQDDGLSAEEQAFAYSAAYVDAIEIVERFRPEIGKAWVAQHGENWREKVAAQIRLYNDMGEKARHEAHAHQAPEQEYTATAYREDIVDADVVDDHREPSSDPRGAAASTSGTRTDVPRAPRRPRSVEQMVYEGEIDDDEAPVDEIIIDGEAEDLSQLGAARARRQILARAESGTSGDVARAVDAKVRRARVNQHYNEVDTGGITGIGSDDAAPLQDVDFQLG